jgi:hypothetical protein
MDNTSTIETDLGSATKNEHFVVMQYSKSTLLRDFWTCSYPKDWWENDESALWNKEFVKVLLEEITNNDVHVSLSFYRAMKKYLYDKEFDCLVEEA